MFRRRKEKPASLLSNCLLRPLNSNTSFIWEALMKVQYLMPCKFDLEAQTVLLVKAI